MSLHVGSGSIDGQVAIHDERGVVAWALPANAGRLVDRFNAAEKLCTATARTFYSQGFEQVPQLTPYIVAWLHTLPKDVP